MRILSMVSIAAILLSMPVVAHVSFDEIRASVWSDGYTLIKMRNGDPLRLSAFDTEGSEVLLTIGSPEGEITNIEYLRAMDE